MGTEIIGSTPLDMVIPSIEGEAEVEVGKKETG